MTRKDLYLERHHITPKCLGGTDDSSNLVPLTAREHYLAHWLLTKIYPNNFKLLTAFSLMAGKLCPTGQRHFSATKFERCKQAQSEATKLRLKHNNPMSSEESRNKVRLSKLGSNNPMAKQPEKVWSARDVEVEFEDGTIKRFSHGTLAASQLNIPYSTWKWSLKHNNGRIPRYEIVKITQGSPKKSNKRFKGYQA